MENNMKDNKGTPSKRTGVKSDVGSDKEIRNETHTELPQPNHTSATPEIPTEMPARDRY